MGLTECGGNMATNSLASDDRFLKTKKWEKIINYNASGGLTENRSDKRRRMAS